MLKSISKLAVTRNGVSWGKRLSAVSLIFVLVTGAVTAVFGASRPQYDTWIALAYFSTAIVVSILLAQLFFDLEGWFEQRGRDLEAQKIFESLDGKGRPVPFTLYLRPFHSTDQIAGHTNNIVRMSTDPSQISHFAHVEERVEFESVVEKALRSIGSVVALGKPLEHWGAGRIKVADDVWQDAIKKLIDNAQLIMLLPSPRPGTSWEVEYVLSSGAVRRTIIVDPPNHMGAANKTYNPAAEWAGVRQVFLDHGFVLPEDDPEGRLVYFSEGTQPDMTSKISFEGQNSVRKFAKNVLKKIKTRQAGT